MCITCGCSGDGHHLHGHEGHDHDHSADHHHEHHDQDSRVITLEQDILHKNQLLAERNRGFFEARGITALNLVSSPGSGKTSILERTLTDLYPAQPCAVIEGDQQTSCDADRIKATGAPVVQINTGKGCHLDAEMVHAAVKHVKPAQDSLLFIENVGNLVCPAMFDLGESARVIIISVTEGDDKPLKYPDMFHSANICLINKIDLLPYVNFNVDKMIGYARQVSHIDRFIQVSATTGQGMEEWYAWLKEQVNVVQGVG
ncbi:MAG: hydrogenase nickel incorporation protein HypB [Lewinellaceae bacterium]|nr:hydrogenase nickel incorporation protein HypB [Saprospiraceae bacterium]MCB9314319.1 hydrogenase nickel incorporation protein HypB [Lewinellaceae bacterium]HRW76856.1 hydrogenase nickel incorporation protein HypB [Saprospiraceae bacterium]